jgi:hypothetical protein
MPSKKKLTLQEMVDAALAEEKRREEAALVAEEERRQEQRQTLWGAYVRDFPAEIRAALIDAELDSRLYPAGIAFHADERRFTLSVHDVPDGYSWLLTSEADGLEYRYVDPGDGIAHRFLVALGQLMNGEM